MVTEDFDIPTFLSTTRKVGGSLIITVDHRIAKYEELEEGDTVKVMIKKLPPKVEDGME